MHSTFVALLSWAAVTAGTLSVVAQHRRVGEEGVEGVSMATWLLFTFIGGFWITYGALSAHSLAVILGSLLCWPLQIGIVVRLAPWRHPRGALQAAGLFVATCVLPATLGGWSYCVYGCGLAMTALRLPQIAELVRTRDASGVSAASWFMGVATASLWIAYYWNVHLRAPLVATSCAGAGSLIIASMAVWRHRQVRRDVVRLEVFAT